MQLAVVIEPLAGQGFEARAVASPGWSAAGTSPADALQRLQTLIAERVKAGAQIVALEIPPPEHPWMKGAGALKDEPLLEDWKQAMAEYRQQIEDNPEVP